MKEKFVRIKGYEGKYDISNYGRIRSYYERTGTSREISEIPQMFLKITNDRRGKFGCAKVSLGKRPNQKKCVVARLVYSAFGNGSIDSKRIIHKDEDYMNNNINNLMAIDPRVFMNKLSSGMANPHAKLNHNIVAKIRSDYKDSCRNIIKELAIKYNVNDYTIKSILNQKTRKQDMYNTH